MRLTDIVNKAWQKVVNKVKRPELEEWYKLAEFLGIDKHTDRDIRSEVTYFTCLKLLSEAIGKLPLKLMKKTPKKGVKEATRHPLYNILRNRPNRHMTSTTWKSVMEYQRNHNGNAFAYIDGYGDKMQLIPLDADKVTIYYDDAMLLSEVPDIWYIYQIGTKSYKFSSEEVIHLKSTISDGIEGIPVRQILQSTITGNQKAQKLQNAMYESGFMAKAVVQHTGSLSDENVKSFLKNIERYAKGDVTAGKGIIPIPVGSTFTPLNTSLGDNQFLELKKYSALQIASAFGIKPVQINDYSKSSYASSENQNLAFLVDTLMVIIGQYEEELNYKLLSDKDLAAGYFFKFNVGALLRADLKTQVDTLTKGISSFLYMPNEAREHLDLEAVPGGDTLVGNGSTIRIEQVGTQWSTLADPSTDTSVAKGGEKVA